MKSFSLRLNRALIIMSYADLNHVGMQADVFVRDCKKRSDERVRYYNQPAATFSVPSLFDYHSTRSYNTRVLNEMLKLLQSMNIKSYVSVQHYPHLSFPIVSLCSTFDKLPFAPHPPHRANTRPLASKTSILFFPFNPPTSATTGTTKFLLVPF